MKETMDCRTDNGYDYERGALWWAVGVSSLCALATTLSLWLVDIDLAKNRKANSDVIYVEFLPPAPVPAPATPPVQKRTEAPRHERVAAVDNTQQVTGKQEQTRTVNTKALFKMTQGGNEKVVDAGNPRAREAEEDKASGTGGGLNPVGNEMLDEGLLGRGVVGELPQPAYPGGNVSGKVVIRVAVDRTGKVTAADYDPRGSTISDADFVEAARRAALQARFAESQAFIQGGRITYFFRIR